MSGATFILAINLAVSGLIAAAFIGIATYTRTRLAGHWLATAYGLGVLYCLFEFAIRVTNGSALLVAAGAAVLLLGMAAFNTGLAVRYKRQVPVALTVSVIVVGTLLTFFVDQLPRYAFTRMMAFQGPYFVMQAVAFFIVFGARGRQRVDNVFAGLLAASSLHFLSKPFIAHAVGGWGANPGAYLASNYAMVSQSLSTVFSMAVALMAMVVLVRDILGDAMAKSETDTLTGLLNRRGFEQRAERAVEHAVGRGMPVSLVIADLDHFKSINDSYGHASGDRVLVIFAHFLQQAATHSQVAGRIGGEEFAIVLPGTNAVAARLFAEGARAAFSAMPIDGLPDEQRFSASFGVADLAPGESLQDMMRRADEALYSAKRDGRNCVRVSRGAVAQQPPERATRTFTHSDRS